MTIVVERESYERESISAYHGGRGAHIQEGAAEAKREKEAEEAADRAEHGSLDKTPHL